MKGCRNAPAGFAMSVCLVPVNVLLNAVMGVCMCVCWVGECTSCVRASMNIV